MAENETAVAVSSLGLDLSASVDLGLGSNRNDNLVGTNGQDTLDGGSGRDTLDGRGNIDQLTGGSDRDIFLFDGSARTDPTTPFVANLSGTGIDVKVSADNITDFAQGILLGLGGDQVSLDIGSFDVSGRIRYREGEVADIRDGNFLVLTDSFANGALAAKAIADNPNITSGAGFFTYFNNQLGFNRLVYSENLADAGDITVLANFVNLDSQRDAGGFSASDFIFASQAEACGAGPLRHGPSPPLRPVARRPP